MKDDAETTLLHPSNPAIGCRPRRLWHGWTRGGGLVEVTRWRRQQRSSEAADGGGRPEVGFLAHGDGRGGLHRLRGDLPVPQLHGEFLELGIGPTRWTSTGARSRRSARLWPLPESPAHRALGVHRGDRAGGAVPGGLRRQARGAVGVGGRWPPRCSGWRWPSRRTIPTTSTPSGTSGSSTWPRIFVAGALWALRGVLAGRTE